MDHYRAAILQPLELQAIPHCDEDRSFRSRIALEAKVARRVGPLHQIPEVRDRVVIACGEILVRRMVERGRIGRQCRVQGDQTGLVDSVLLGVVAESAKRLDRALVWISLVDGELSVAVLENRSQQILLRGAVVHEGGPYGANLIRELLQGRTRNGQPA
ncbi:hypothetical protein [Leifsonia sp. NCR5]|uniref:hypothetical protein n=1 Tax=Leifsonia sp. NCR5 TaxID=1978342 RepID=UPI002119F8BD|nr:hypothetical protein [Leifsonia sp. NCR5]